jgi:probable HAF family extracellular repeat protein
MARRSNTLWFFPFSALLGVLALISPRAWGEILYTVTDLGTLPGSISSQATGINKAGEVVGNTFIPAGNNQTLYHAFLYTGGQMQDLGTLGGGVSEATGINDAGQVAGTSLTTQSNEDPFIYSGAQINDLGTLGGQATFANGINNSGQVVGWANVFTNGIGNVHAFLYSVGQMRDLGSPRENSEAYGINDAGQIIGDGTVGGSSYALLYSDGQWQDLGTPPGCLSSSGRCINNAGQVVGIAGSQAFLYANGQMQYVNTLGTWVSSSASGINDYGLVVGSAETASHYWYAFLYDYNNGSVIDLNTLIDPSSGFTLEGATAINDEGLIVGYGYNSAGQEDAFLLTPTPEPATLSLLALGGVALLRRRYRIFHRLSCTKIPKYLFSGTTNFHSRPVPAMASTSVSSHRP